MRPPRRLTARTRLAAQAAVLAAVVAGTTGFAALHKQIVVEVDGQSHTVTAFGRTVGDVLAGQGVVVGAHDSVVPAVGQVAADGARIVVAHGKEVRVEVDGQERTVWTTARTVGGVVDQLGLRDSRASASRSESVGRDVLRVSTAKHVRVAIDGSTLDLTTTGSTVREVLSQAGVVLGEHDLVSVPLDAAAVDGLVVMVTRVQTTVALADRDRGPPDRAPGRLVDPAWHRGGREPGPRRHGGGHLRGVPGRTASRWAARCWPARCWSRRPTG